MQHKTYTGLKIRYSVPKRSPSRIKNCLKFDNETANEAKQ